MASIDTIVGGDATNLRLDVSNFVSPETYGAAGDGVTSDSASFAAAMAHCAETGKTLLGRSGATYRFTTTASVSVGAKPFNIDLGGATILCDESAGIRIDGPTTTLYTRTLAAEPLRGSPYIDLTDVTGIERGHMILITSSADSQAGDAPNTHVYIVDELDAPNNRVYVEGTVVADITVQQIVDSGFPAAVIGDISVSVLELAPGVKVSNGRFVMVETTGDTHIGLQMRRLSHAVMENLTFEGNSRRQSDIDYCGYADVTNCTYADFGYTEMDSGYANLVTAPSGSSFGYGLLVQRTWQTTVSGCRGLKGWHTIDFSRGTMFGFVTGCFFGRNGYGVSCHSSAWHVVIKGSVFNGSAGVTLGRCAYGTVTGCDFIEMSGHCISTGDGLAEVYIHNNTIRYREGSGSGAAAVYSQPGGSMPPLVKSAGYPRIFSYKGNEVYGSEGIIVLGFHDNSVVSARHIVEGNGHFGCQYANVLDAQHVSVRDNRCEDINGQFFFQLSVPSGYTTQMIVANNHHIGAASTMSGSALIVIQGSTTASRGAEVSIIGNSGRLQHLIRFNAAVTINQVVGNVTEGRFALNTATITNFINNCHGDVVSFGGSVTLTNELGTRVLV